jgi:hypothetical protein
MKALGFGCAWHPHLEGLKVFVRIGVLTALVPVAIILQILGLETL